MNNSENLDNKTMIELHEEYIEELYTEASKIPKENIEAFKEKLTEIEMYQRHLEEYYEQEGV